MECGDYHDREPRSSTPTHPIPQRPRTPGTAKRQVQEILDTLPDDISLEAIQYHIDLRQKFEQGWDEGDRLIRLEDVQRRLANWLTKWSSRAWSSAR
jgi:hypothetical protein